MFFTGTNILYTIFIEEASSAPNKVFLNASDKLLEERKA